MFPSVVVGPSIAWDRATPPTIPDVGKRHEVVDIQTLL